MWVCLQYELNSQGERMYGIPGQFSPNHLRYAVKGLKEYTYLFTDRYRGNVVDEFITSLNFAGISVDREYGNYLGEIPGTFVGTVSINNFTVPVGEASHSVVRARSWKQAPGYTMPERHQS